MDSPLPTVGSGQGDSFDVHPKPNDGNDNIGQGQNDTPIPSNTTARKMEVQRQEVNNSCGESVCPTLLAVVVTSMHLFASVSVCHSGTELLTQLFLVSALLVNCMLCIVTIFRRKESFIAWLAFYSFLCLVIMAMLAHPQPEKDKATKVILL